MNDLSPDQIRTALRTYDGPDMHIMEVCGSHTGAISKSGIPGLLSDHIQLISGPGCPVCVTPSAYIDKLIDLALSPGNCVVTFGDLLRVPGSKESLSQAKGRGAHTKLVYSPLDILDLAVKDKDTTFIFAAVGFETTVPAYALLVDQLVSEQIPNVRLLTAIRTMPEIINSLCEKGAPINGFLAPGHVAVVTGSMAFEPLAKKYVIPFAVSGFKPEQILLSLYGLTLARGKGKVMNFYPSVVTREGNIAAKNLAGKYFEKRDAIWRGLGSVPNSGLFLKEAYRRFDAESKDLKEDHKMNPNCICDKVLMGMCKPTKCPLFGRACTPMHPQGACMVSQEGNCLSWYASGRT